MGRRHFKVEDQTTQSDQKMQALAKNSLLCASRPCQMWLQKLAHLALGLSLAKKAQQNGIVEMLPAAPKRRNCLRKESGKAPSVYPIRRRNGRPRTRKPRVSASCALRMTQPTANERFSLF